MELLLPVTSLFSPLSFNRPALLQKITSACFSPGWLCADCWIPIGDKHVSRALGKRWPNSAVGSRPRRTPRSPPHSPPHSTTTREARFMFYLLEPVSLNVPLKEMGRSWDVSGTPFHFEGILEGQFLKYKEALVEKFHPSQGNSTTNL